MGIQRLPRSNKWQPAMHRTLIGHEMLALSFDVGLFEPAGRTVRVA
jgi:hypothetical protein